MRIWLCVQPADMRCSFDRLAELAASVTEEDPLSGHLFLFRARSGDRMKILYWDRDGYTLWYKRLEEGTFKLPKVEPQQRSVQLRASELAMMLDGIDPEKRELHWSVMPSATKQLIGEANRKKSDFSPVIHLALHRAVVVNRRAS